MTESGLDPIIRRVQALALDIQNQTDRLPDAEVYHLCDRVLFAGLVLRDLDEGVDRPDMERSVVDLAESLREGRRELHGGPLVAAHLQAAACTLSMAAELLLESWDEARAMLAAVLLDEAGELLRRSQSGR